MAARGRHPDPSPTRGEHVPRGDARSTRNNADGSGGGGRAGERILREVDSIQSRLGEMAADAEGTVGRLQRLAMLGEISGFVAHEFNNILTPLLAHAQVALRQPRDAERMALALERVVASVKRATAVADSILELAKQDGAGGAVPRGTGPDAQERPPVKMEKQSTRREGGGSGAIADVSRCVRRAVEEMGGAWARVEVQQGLTATIAEHDLQQVVLNLLLNARRANAAHDAVIGARDSTQSRIAINAATRALPRRTQECSYIDRYMPELLRTQTQSELIDDKSDNTMCVLEVVDAGGGVAAAALLGLERRGFRVVEPRELGGSGIERSAERAGGDASAASGSLGISGQACLGDEAGALSPGPAGKVEGGALGGVVGGSGLGLEICRRVVERAGGWIEIESRAGVGTTVRVWLGRAGGAGSASAAA